MILLYRSPMRSHRLVAALATAALAVTGCSGGDSLDPDEEADRLEDAMLTVDDLPDGFEEGEPADDEGDEDFEDCLEEVDVDPDALDDATVADEGPEAFEVADDEGGFGSIEVELRSLDDEGAGSDIIEAMGEGDFQDCVLESAEEDAEEDGEEISDLEIEDIDAGAEGDEAIALRFSADFNGFEVTSDLHVVRVGPRVIRLEAVSVDGGLDEDAVDDAFEAILERLEAG